MNGIEQQAAGQRRVRLSWRSAAWHWPLGVALLAFGVALAFLLAQSLKTDQGGTHLVYALDDPYIHMAIAKNLAAHGVWGVSRYDFAAASSSPLWTLLLAGVYLVVGPSAIAPFILNIIFAACALAIAYAVLDHYRVAKLYNAIVLLGLLFLAPLPALVFVGMEHSAQTAATLLFVFLAVRALCAPASTRRAAYLWLGLAPLLTGLRYEGLFVVGVVALLLLVRRRWVEAVVLGVLGALPPLLYGLLSVANGGGWLPNSVLVKNRPFHLGQILTYISLDKTGDTLVGAPHTLALGVAALVLFALRYRRERTLWRGGNLWLVIFLVTAVLHLQLAAIGWFYRYEAYLVALGVVALGAAALDEGRAWVRPVLRLWPLYAALAVIGFLAVRPLTDRGERAFTQIARASNNIYEQQYQMGLFLGRYYPGTSVAANDIGAIDFLADIHPLDLWGLGDATIARKEANGTYTVADVVALAQTRKVRIAVVYSPLYPLSRLPYETSGQPYDNLIPSTWVKVGQWSLDDRLIVGGSDVIFYAVDPAARAALQADLKAFAPQLPASVRATLQKS